MARMPGGRGYGWGGMRCLRCPLVGVGRGQLVGEQVGSYTYMVGEVSWPAGRAGGGVDLDLGDQGRLHLDVGQRLPVAEGKRPGRRQR